MINFDNIENSLRHEIADDNGDGSCDLTNTALLELITLLRQAEKDAARYRWLRSCDTAESKKFVSESGGWIVGLGVLDGMIDEAMQCK